MLTPASLDEQPESEREVPLGWLVSGDAIHPPSRRALHALGDRPITIGRELTKQFEQIITLPAHEFSAWLSQDKHHSSGEFCLAIHPQAARSEAAGQGERVLKLLLAELPTKTAVKLAADISGEPKNALYDLAIRLKNGDA